MLATSAILVRVIVAKIVDRDRLVGLLHSAPVVQNDPEWNCVSWVRVALETLQKDGKAVGTAVLGWQEVRDCAMDYAQRKKDAHRFDGTVECDQKWPATYDVLEKEIRK